MKMELNKSRQTRTLKHIQTGEVYRITRPQEGTRTDEIWHSLSQKALHNRKHFDTSELGLDIADVTEATAAREDWEDFHGVGFLARLAGPEYDLHFDVDWPLWEFQRAIEAKE